MWGEFTYKNIFNKIIQGRRLTKDDQIPGTIPFVMAGTTNTGVVNYISNPIAILPPALLIAFTTSIGSFFICLITYTLINRQSVQGKISLHLFMNALKNIAKVFFALGIGILLGILINTSNIQIVFNSWYLLLVFIFLIGVELAFTSFDRSWLSWKILLVPVAAFMGSCLASVCLESKLLVSNCIS